VSSVEKQTGHLSRGRMLSQPQEPACRPDRCALHNAKPFKFAENRRISGAGL